MSVITVIKRICDFCGEEKETTEKMRQLVATGLRGKQPQTPKIGEICETCQKRPGLDRLIDATHGVTRADGPNRDRARRGTKLVYQPLD